MSDAFRRLFGQLYPPYEPYPYQERLATALASESPPNCLAVPTAGGKEAAIVASFLHQLQTVRHWRRLAYALPTRSLVSQVADNTKQAISQAGLDVAVHVLMGGAVDRDWTERPEQPSVLIGTQDQLLSRALNRGYAQTPFQWPIDFGLLSNDCLWAFDEVQLMQAGFRTSVQLQGLRDRYGTLLPSHSIWLSATLDESSLQTADYQRPLEPIRLSKQDREHPDLKPRLTAQKQLEQWQGSSDPDAIAALAQQRHTPGTLTLVVVNQVPRARQIAQALKQAGTDCQLVHSRFRPAERPSIEALDAFNGIIVATQAIEAGVDLDAQLLITELCPWSSFVQRCGRCNRKGKCEGATVIWIDVADSEALPYTPQQLATCRAVLHKLRDASIPTLSAQGIAPTTESSAIPRANDALELFHTDEDLQGSRIDVGAFVRGSEDTDVALAWRDFETQAGDKPDPESWALQRKELCRVPIRQARQFLNARLNGSPIWRRSWVWNWTRRDWEQPYRLVAGMSLLLPRSAGGYSPELGFTGRSGDQPTELSLKRISQDSNQDDNRSLADGWISLAQHSDDVARHCQALASLLPEPLQAPLVRAGRWHDYGKAHPAWQQATGRADGTLYAKVARGQWQGLDRRGLRHELASMLAARNEGESPLVQYLILCHHGKVRTSVEPWPSESPPSNDPSNERPFARGIWDGDRIRTEVNLGGGWRVEPQTLQLAEVAFSFGEWTNDIAQLLEQYGPYQLAYLEALLRVADRRASAAPGGGSHAA